MKLYDGGRAPNPRRVRMFLAEKGITVPTEQVDLGAMQHKIAGLHRDQPACSGCRRWCSTTAPSSPNRSRSAAISRCCSRSRRCSASAPRRSRWSRCGSGGCEIQLLAPVSQRCSAISHPAMKEMEVPQVPAWAEANKPRVIGFLELLDRELANARSSPATATTVADITGLVAVDFMKPAKLAVPETCQCEALARRGLGAAERARLALSVMPDLVPGIHVLLRN